MEKYHYFSMALQLPASIHLPRHLAKNEQRTAEKNFLAIMVRSTDRSASWKQVPGKIFKRVRESGPSHDTIQSALGHETLFLQVFPFFPRVLLASPFVHAKMGLGAQEELVIRLSTRGKKTSRDIVQIASVRKRNENSIVTFQDWKWDFALF